LSIEGKGVITEFGSFSKDKRLASGFAIETDKVKGVFKAHAQAYAILLNSCKRYSLNQYKNSLLSCRNVYLASCDDKTRRAKI
jgi:hypothetical protein